MAFVIANYRLELRTTAQHCKAGSIILFIKLYASRTYPIYRKLRLPSSKKKREMCVYFLQIAQSTRIRMTRPELCIGLEKQSALSMVKRHAQCNCAACFLRSIHIFSLVPRRAPFLDGRSARTFERDRTKQPTSNFALVHFFYICQIVLFRDYPYVHKNNY